MQTKVNAGRNGIIGALTEDLIDTSLESRSRNRRAQTHPGCRVSGPVATSSRRCTSTGIPQWVQSGGVASMLERLAEKQTRDRIRSDIARDGLNNWGRLPSWDCVQILDLAQPAAACSAAKARTLIAAATAMTPVAGTVG